MNIRPWSGYKFRNVLMGTRLCDTPPRIYSMEDVMAKLFPCLWFDGNAEEAATFYATLLPDSHVDGVWRSPAETPSGPAGMVMTVDFTLAGQQLQGLNGGPEFKFNEAVSFVIDCDDQAEVDRLWDALTASGGEPGPCGWLKDRFGLSRSCRAD
jgi:predicted 3-demethylubiquinone-9 3-methyltransferase (glyoxalase superfamily)